MHKTEQNYCTKPIRRKITMATVSCLFTLEFEFKHNYCRPHGHGCTEIVFYSGCSGILILNNDSYHYKDGYFSIYQPGQQHADKWKTPGHQFCVGVVGCGADKLPSGLWKGHQALFKAAEELCKESQSRSACRAERLDLLTGLLVLALRSHFSGQSEGRPLPYQVRVLKELLDSRYTEPIQLHDLADRFYVHPDYLRRLFRRALGESPLAYLIRQRLEKAQELLSHIDWPVFKISEAVGFSNPYYFSRLFKKHIGQTPSEYRASHPPSPLPKSSSS